jgi:antitoxin VapB
MLVSANAKGTKLLPNYSPTTPNYSPIGSTADSPFLHDDIFIILTNLETKYILWYIPIGRFVMQTAKIFTNGRSQAIRLPKEYRFSGDDVYINKIGKIVVLIPKDDPWSVLANSLDQFSDDFMNDRDQPPQNSREEL